MPSHHPPKAQGQRGSGGAEPKRPQSLTSRYKRGGGDLHRLQLNHKRRLPQDGPAAAQLRWTTYSGGVLHLLHRKARDIKEPCGVCDYLTRSKELISSLSPSLAQTPTRSQFERGLRPLPSQSDFPPAGALLSFIFKNPPPSPHDRPWSMRTTDAGQRLIHRVSAHRKRAPEIVDERLALLGMNCAMLRKLAGPRPARRAQRTHWRRMFGAQVDSNPSHRCPSHVRLSPALVSAPPHVPVRPFVWGCGS